MQCRDGRHMTIRNIWHQRGQWLRCMRIKGRRRWRLLERSPMKLLKWMTIGIVGCFAVFSILIKAYDWGEAGYTAFGSLFTALAFAGMIVTVLLQRAELREQRKELRAQRRELEGQKRELEIQNRTAQLQRFENSFFHLLDGFKKTVEALSLELVGYKGYSHQISACAAFEKDIQNNMIYFQQWGKGGMILDLSVLLKKLPTHGKKFFYEYHMIVKFIYTHDAFRGNKVECQDYFSVLNLSLTNSEYLLLLYDAIVDSDRRDVVNEFSLFKGYSLLNNSHTPLEPWHILFFEPSAFGTDYEEYIRKNGLEGKTLADFLPSEQAEEESA